MVYRLYAEKKKGFDVEARQLLHDIKGNLSVPAEDLRFLNRYDISGIDEKLLSRAKGVIFSEPNADTLYEETFPVEDGWKVFAMEYLPGQYDQRADSAEQCIAMLSPESSPRVVCAKVICLKGLNDKAVERVKGYCINPIESREASLEKPETLDMEYPVPPEIMPVEGFIKWEDEAVKAYHKENAFAMSAEDLLFCRDYFRDTEHRDPTTTELRVIDTYWSDHCRHTTFLTKLGSVKIEDGDYRAAIEEALGLYFSARAELYAGRDKDVSLMDMATIGAKLLKKHGLLNDLDESDEINACSIKVNITVDGHEEPWLVQFKNETHNHPTEIEPFGGAATCLGGAIRDPLSGRAYVYQAMRITGAADPRTPYDKTMPGKLPQRTITRGAAHGFSSYGNQIGLATGKVHEFYHEGYAAKRMEIGAVIGACPAVNVIREKPVEGDIIILLGGRTGRDGCGGATGSSVAHDISSIEVCGSQVQKGNPPIERKLQRLFRNPNASRLIKCCNDFGAGGVSVAIGELARGLEINLDAVPKKYEGLDGTELAISESQERMAVVLDKNDVDKFIALADGENLEATPVAVVTRDERLVMMNGGKAIVDISREFLDTNGVTQHADAVISAPAGKNHMEKLPAAVEGKSIREAFLANLSRLDVCSQKGLEERFDSTIGAASILMPLGGKYQLTPEEGMVARIPVLGGKTDDATAMTYGFMPRLSEWSPFHGAAYAAAQAVCRLAAVGAQPFRARLTNQEYFESMTPDPKKWGKPAAALLGSLTAQAKLGLPAIGGKDSMSGSFEDIGVPPTLVTFAVSMTKTGRTVSAAFKKPGVPVYLLKAPKQPSGLPDWEGLKANIALIEKAAQRANAVSLIDEGGLAAAIAKMALGSEIGFAFDGKKTAEELYLPEYCSFVIELEGDAPEGFVKIGCTTDKPFIDVNGERIPLGDVRTAYTEPLERIFPTVSSVKPALAAETIAYGERSPHRPAVKYARPRVFIPVFPGTNCEYDSAAAFERAGAKAETLVLKNLTRSGIEQSIEEMAKRIADSQIVMLPGGFSAGDEPEGSGKFIAAVFRSRAISDAVHDLLARDGLMLGICNGFQALIKLGLLPYGEIRDIKPDDPTLTFNTLGRHASRLAYTRIASVKSPWMAHANVGETYAIAFSHGEGRFVADDKTLEALRANGQIFSQYVDLDGVPSADGEFNPNGSVWAIEGITSPDGRILGKMGHNERFTGDNLINVPGEKDMGLFLSGVEYFA